MAGTLTWLGHGSYRLDTPGGKRIYVDPWLGGPTFPESEKPIDRIDVLVLTHGHGDHIGSAVEICKQHAPPVVSIVEITGWLANQGVEKGLEIPGINKGGTRTIDGVSFTLTDARHSSSGDDGSYLGDPAGVVIKLEDGYTLYFSGDTCAFMDMQLIARLHEPDIAILPIGDHFTMGPREAAVALELLGVKRCMPGHYGTFPLLTGTPEQLREAAPGVTVEAPEAGGTIQL
jgi:L-ascorbate metabolism protein UlaG (beta-lactamase superfamily)